MIMFNRPNHPYPSFPSVQSVTHNFVLSGKDLAAVTLNMFHNCHSMIFNLSDAPEVMYWNGIGSGSEGIWVDKLSRKLFPLVFTLFNLLYWIICCTSGHIPYPANVTPHPIELIEGRVRQFC